MRKLLLALSAAAILILGDPLPLQAQDVFGGASLDAREHGFENWDALRRVYAPTA